MLCVQVPLSHNTFPRLHPPHIHPHPCALLSSAAIASHIAGGTPLFYSLATPQEEAAATTLLAQQPLRPKQHRKPRPPPSDETLVKLLKKVNKQRNLSDKLDIEHLKQSLDGWEHNDHGYYSPHTPNQPSKKHMNPGEVLSALVKAPPGTLLPV